MALKLRYSARDGQSQLHQGFLEGSSEAEAVQLLAQQGLTVVSIERVGRPSGAANAGPVNAADRVLLLREMATLLAAGVTLGDVLPGLVEAYAKQPLGAAVQRMDDVVRRGGSLSDALEVPGLNFPAYVLALVTAGEASGDLAQALDDAAQQLELQRQSAEEMKSALLYPTILVVVGVLAVLLVFVGVVPRFAPMLNSARGEIPAISRWVIETGVFVKSHWQAFAYGASALAGIVWFALRQQRWRQVLLEALMKAPAVGPWLLQAELGRWATVLGALLSNRVPIVEALALSSRVLNSQRLREGVNRAARSLQQGQSLTDALASQGWFPPTRLNLVRVGERSGELPKMLLALGKSQTEAARLTQKRLLTLIEPAAILTIGTVIAVVMVSVMMVITSMNQMAG